jgi:hypothetical protein
MRQQRRRDNEPESGQNFDLRRRAHPNSFGSATCHLHEPFASASHPAWRPALYQFLLVILASLGKITAAGPIRISRIAAA